MPLQPDVAQAIALAHQIAERDQLWPGWRFAETPLALYGGGEGWLIGHPCPPVGYAPAGVVAGRTIHCGPILCEMAANTAAVVAGHLTAVAILPDQPLTSVARYARLLLHEAFHVFQQAALPAAFSDWSAPRMLQAMTAYPENDPPNNGLARVENRLLLAAAAGDDRAVARFLAVRGHRQRRLERRGLGELVGYEQFVEFNEGTPTYVELRAGMDRADLANRLEACNRGGKWAAYQRFYYSGAAIALTLDRRQPGWQARLAAGGTTLQALLAATLTEPLPPVSAIVKAEGFAAILEEEEAGEAERKRRVEALLAELEAGAGAPVEILLPADTGVIWNPTNVIQVRAGVRLHPTNSGATGPDGLRVTAERLCLESASPDGRRLMLRLPAPPQWEQGERFRLKGEGLQIDAPRGEVSQRPEGGLRVQL